MTTKVAGNDVDRVQEYIYSETYGLIRRFPYFVGHDKTSNLYKLTQAIDRQRYRLDEIIEIINDYKKLYGNIWEQAIGEKLTQIGKNLGIKKILYEPHTSYLNRLYNLSNFSIVGATESEIKNTIFYFINDETLNKDTQISIINPYEGTVYKFFSATGTIHFFSKVSPEEDKEKFISKTQLGSELYQIRISISYGDDTDRSSYDYWVKEDNLSLLYDLLKDLSPVGMIFTLKIEPLSQIETTHDRDFEIDVTAS